MDKRSRLTRQYNYSFIGGDAATVNQQSYEQLPIDDLDGLSANVRHQVSMQEIPIDSAAMTLVSQGGGG